MVNKKLNEHVNEIEYFIGQCSDKDGVGIMVPAAEKAIKELRYLVSDLEGKIYYDELERKYKTTVYKPKESDTDEKRNW